MSGRLPIHVNMINPFVWSSEGSLPLEMTTMASKLTSTGYRCYHVGKWHMGFRSPGLTPIGRGYDTFLGYCESLSHLLCLCALCPLRRRVNRTART